MKHLKSTAALLATTIGLAFGTAAQAAPTLQECRTLAKGDTSSFILNAKKDKAIGADEDKGYACVYSVAGKRFVATEALDLNSTAGAKKYADLLTSFSKANDNKDAVAAKKDCSAIEKAAADHPNVAAGIGGALGGLLGNKAGGSIGTVLGAGGGAAAGSAISHNCK